VLAAACLVALVSTLVPAAAVAADLVDAVLAEVEHEVVTASDVAVARALGLFGLAPSAAPIVAADVDRLVDARLLLREADRLQMSGEAAAEVEAAWTAATTRAGGPASVVEWLARTGIDAAWARRFVADDLAWRAFADARFRAFVFVTEQDVTDALGPGVHDDDARERQREALRSRETERRLAQWLREARTRTAVRLVLTPGATVPCPLPMPAPEARAPGADASPPGTATRGGRVVVQ
jgi:hypothetical protein